MSARIYIHPHTAREQHDSATLAAFLTGKGFDMDKIQVYHHAGAKKSNVYELVRAVASAPEGTIYQGFDGMQFLHPTYVPPAAA